MPGLTSGPVRLEEGCGDYVGALTSRTLTSGPVRLGIAAYGWRERVWA